jgi:large subunit ribosomal protein L10
MTRQEKNKIVTTLVGRLASTDYFYIVDAGGLNVEAINDFRRRCFQAGIVYCVVKNTLIRKALEQFKSEADYTDFSNTVLKGYSGILFATEKGNVPAHILKDFRKQRGIKSPVLKGASMDRVLFIGEEHLDTLSKFKSKDELLGELIGLLQSPVMRVLASLQSGKEQLMGVLKALTDQKT